MQIGVLLLAGDHSFAKKALPTHNPLLRAWQWWCAYLLPGEAAAAVGSLCPVRPGCLLAPSAHASLSVSCHHQVCASASMHLAAGMGMFSEAYFIFAIGNIEPLFEVQMPNCWACSEGTACTCNQTTVDNVQVGLVGS